MNGPGVHPSLYGAAVTAAPDVRRTSAACTSFLRGAADAEWTAPVPELDFTVVGVIAHAAECCLWYAIDLAAGGVDLKAIEHRVRTDGPADVVPTGVVDTFETYAGIVAAVVDASPPTARGFHPMGTADPSGFAAMACDEMLIHTHDAARGLGRDFEPSPDLAAAVLRRLFPWVTTSDDPWRWLQWANGRIALDGRPRQNDWAWHCAPLDVWDGHVPTRPTRPA